MRKPLRQEAVARHGEEDAALPIEESEQHGRQRHDGGGRHDLGDARLADSIAAMRQFGIADMVERQFSASAAGATNASGDGQ